LNLAFNITAPVPTGVDATVLASLLTGYKENYNVTEQINISISSADVKSASIDIMCTDSTNGNLYSNSSFNKIIVVDNNTLANQSNCTVYILY